MSTTTVETLRPGPGSGLSPSEQYGARELKSVFQRFMTMGVLASAGLNILLILLAVAAMYLNQKLHEAHKTRVVVVPFQQLQPPSLNKQPQEQIKVAQQVAPPAVGIPVPVPDAQAPKQQELASLEDINKASQGANTGTGNDIVIAA